MFRKNVNGDISDEDFKKILVSFNYKYDIFLKNFIMPEVISFYITNSFYQDAMQKGDFKQHYNSTADVINVFGEDYKKIKTEVIKLLKIKYPLKVVIEE